MAMKVSEFLTKVTTGFKTFLENLKNVCILILKVALPIGGGMIVTDILLGTKFDVIGRCVEQILKLGITPDNLTKILYVVGGVVLVLYIKDK